MIHFPEADPLAVAYTLIAEREAAGEFNPAADWMEELIGLPFRGLPRAASLTSVLLATSELTAEWLITIAVDGLPAAYSAAMEADAMADRYTGTDRTEPPALRLVRTEAA